MEKQTTPDTEWEKEIRNAGDFHTEAPVVHASNVRSLLTSRDTYWKEREALNSEREYLRGFRDGQELEKERVREGVVKEMDRCDSCAFNPCEKHKRPITRVETKSDLLRSEIEKLEDELDRIKKYQIMVGEHKYYCECKAGNDYLDKFLQVLRDDSKQLTSIITRYKEELLELENQK